MIPSMIDSWEGYHREKKMLKGHLPRVIYHQVYEYTRTNPGPLWTGCARRSPERPAEFGVWGLGFRFQGLGVWVWVSGFKVWGLGLRFQGLGFWVWISGFRGWGLRLRV